MTLPRPLGMWNIGIGREVAFDKNLCHRDPKVTASRAEQLIKNLIESQYDLVDTSKEI
jgi:hypothetical protein